GRQLLPRPPGEAALLGAPDRHGPAPPGAAAHPGPADLRTGALGHPALLAAQEPERDQGGPAQHGQRDQPPHGGGDRRAARKRVLIVLVRVKKGAGWSPDHSTWSDDSAGWSPGSFKESPDHSTWSSDHVGWALDQCRAEYDRFGPVRHQPHPAL